MVTLVNYSRVREGGESDEGDDLVAREVLFDPVHSL